VACGVALKKVVAAIGSEAPPKGIMSAGSRLFLTSSEPS